MKFLYINGLTDLPSDHDPMPWGFVDHGNLQLQTPKEKPQKISFSRILRAKSPRVKNELKSGLSRYSFTDHERCAIKNKLKRRINK